MCPVCNFECVVNIPCISYIYTSASSDDLIPFLIHTLLFYKLRQDSITDKWYDCSSHMLWVGERTRQLDHAHVAFVRGINNPVGIKISDKASPEELLEIIDAVNPDNIPGRVTIIVRMGAEKLREKLPILIRAVQREGL